MKIEFREGEGRREDRSKAKGLVGVGQLASPLTFRNLLDNGKVGTRSPRK